MGQRTPFGTYTNEPSVNTAELRAAKKLSLYGTTEPRYCCTREPFPLLDRDPELLERLEQLGIDLLQAVQLGPLLGGRVVADALIVDRPVLHVGPVGLGHLQPVAVRAEPPLEHPGRLTFLLGDQPDDVLGEARGDGLRLISQKK